MTLSKEQAKDVLTLSKNGKIESNWLIHSVEVPLTQEVKDALIQDTKTPTKLKESESVEISFAIALDKKKNITPIKNAVMYTFLPTSFSFGLDFIVNANFITDAGRQQIVKDCAWNEFIFTQIPKTYLKWMAENVAKQYSGWYEVLPIRVNNDDELSEAYANALSDALGTIPFVRTVNNEMVLLKQALMDSVGLKSAIPKNIFDIFVQAEVSKIASSHSIVSSEVGQTLQQLYGITSIIDTHVCTILEKSNDYLKNFSDKQILIFLNWLRLYSLNHIGDFRNFVSHMPILSDENHNLIEPVNSFFPSDYSDKNPDVSEDAKIIRKSLAELFSDEITDWLKELGVQEMSNLSVIEKVLCEDNYIHQGNAIDVLRFIFECDKKENVFANVKKSRLEKIKIRTTNGTLKYASELYLSDVYNPICKIQEIYWNDIFVSDEYPENESEYAEWALFLKKLGVNDDLKLSQIRYDDGSWVMNDAKIQQCIYTAKNREYNTAWDGRKFYLGCAGGICLYAMSSPLLTIHASNQMHDFYIQFWGRIFSNALPNKNDDYIFGNTGWGYIKKALLNDYAYLGTSFIKWVAETKNLIPASDGCLYSVRNVLINSQSNKETFGRYFPVLAINGSLRNEWAKELPFKEGLSLFECLGVLQRISEDDGTKDLVSENKKKINKIYEYIIDTFDFSENSSDFTLVRNWGGGSQNSF